MKGLKVQIPALAIGACSLAAIAQTPRLDQVAGDAEEDAQALVDAVLGETVEDMLAAEHEALADWAQTLIDEALALDMAGNRGLVPGESPAPVVEKGFAGNGANTAEVLVFMSLAVPESSWRQWSREAARVGALDGAAGCVRRRVFRDREPDRGTACRGRRGRGHRSATVPVVPDRLGSGRGGGAGGCAGVHQPRLFDGSAAAARSGDREHRPGRGA